MTIILFLIDTSASMCQRAHVNGVQKSYLDIAKGAVETFLKFRQRSQDCMGDRYMLLTFEDPPSNVKAGWKENHATFMNELKNLQSNGLTSMSEALKNAFDLLNLNRMQSGIDTYGQGRCPFYLETSVIIVITDGGKYSFRNGVHNEIVLPLHAQIPGTKLTKEPFRWDQRLFSLVLRMAGHKIDERLEAGKVPHDDSPIEKMCEVTGGRSYKVRSHYVLNQCIESLVQKVQPGVVVQFDQMMPKELKDGEVQDIVFQPTKKMIYVQKHPNQKTYPVGYWPIPEPYWPDSKAGSLPARDAHPRLRIITPGVEEPPLVRNFPLDKYELEAGPLALQILAKKEPNKCWPVVVTNGVHGGHEMPFGYLKANATFTQVHLLILPINYPVLLPLLNDLFHKFSTNPPNDWIYKFSNYVRSIPQYYCPFLRRALSNANVPYQLLQYIIPESLDSYLSQTVANYLKQLKNTAKQDQENLCMRIFKQLKQPKPTYHQIETAKLSNGTPLKRELVTHPMLRDAFHKLHSDISIFENYPIVVPVPRNHLANPTAQSMINKNSRNPFDIRRKDLIDEISRMRENFFKLPNSNLQIRDVGNCLPISEMGNYQEYLKNKETPLREIEPTNVRQHMFGNPYKKDKHMVMVDEADLGDVVLNMKPGGIGIPGSGNKKMEGGMVITGNASGMMMMTTGPNPGGGMAKFSRKRKAGPIARDFKFRRLSTSSIDSQSSNTSTSAVGSSSSISAEDLDLCSDSSSIISANDDGDDENRLVMDFDSDPEPPPTLVTPVDEFQQVKNGYLTNGELNTEENIPEPVYPIDGVVSPHLQTPSSNTSTYPFHPVPIVQPHLTPPQNGATISTTHLNSTAPILSGGSQLSNINDTLEISKILQQSCSSQNGTTATTTGSTSTSSGGVSSRSSNRNLSSSSGSGNSNSISNSGNSESVNTRTESGASDDLSRTSGGSSGISGNSVGVFEAEVVGARKSRHQGLENLSRDSEPRTANSNSGNGGESSGSRKHHSRHSGPRSKQSELPDSNLSNNSTVSNSTSNNVKSEPSHSRTNSNNHTHHSGQTSEVAVESPENLEAIREANFETRTIVFKDIRLPGRNYSQLLKHLELIKGPFDTRFNFIQMCITEALRFRRKKMADTIQEWWDNQLENSLSVKQESITMPPPVQQANKSKIAKMRRNYKNSTHRQSWRQDNI